MFNNYHTRGNRGGATYGQYQYQMLPFGYEGTQTSGLIGKVMGLLAFSFIFAAVGAYVGSFLISGMGAYLFVVIAGLVVLIALQFLIQRSGVNLVLLYLFTFLEGMGLGPLISYYLQAANVVLTQAFLITAITSLGLGIYAWTTKRDFSRLGDYLFFGLLLLLVGALVNVFFHAPLFTLIIAVAGVAIFSGYILYYVQSARSMADTMPNAIGLTVSLFLAIINLFLFILQLLEIFSGRDDRR
ncbi:MAG: Bax inhibitor-1/YccA family protein [Ktedonobacteraceae bacterium]|nr:Bax inhibitor-1/YccA family protein [Ktedonobacteraceae bacterium]